MVLTMFNAMVEDFVDLSMRGIFIDRMVADVVTGDGRKFCRFFGLRKVRESNHHSMIYEVSAIPPKFRMTTPSTRRLEAAYAEHQRSSKPAHAVSGGESGGAAESGHGG